MMRMMKRHWRRLTALRRSTTSGTAVQWRYMYQGGSTQYTMHHLSRVERHAACGLGMSAAALATRCLSFVWQLLDDGRSWFPQPGALNSPPPEDHELLGATLHLPPSTHGFHLAGLRSRVVRPS